MAKTFQIDDPLFWNIFRYLETLKRKTSVTQIYKEWEIDEETLLGVLDYFERLGQKFYWEKDHKNGPWLIPPTYEAKIEASFSLSQWLALEAHIPLLLRHHDRPSTETLLQKIQEIEQIYPQYDLWSAELKSSEEELGLTRVILKAPKECFLPPPEDLAIINPHIVSYPSGETLWSGSFENLDAPFYEWLASMGDQVEILWKGALE